MNPRTLLVGLALHLLLAAVATALVLLATAAEAGAQQPPDPRLEAQALQIERQLLCPQCTNKRVDVCELPICDDMRRSIREQLSQGRSPDDILVYFRSRYGQRVLAELPREGFNLVLFGWTGGSIALVALLGGLYLYRLRRASPSPAPAGEEPPEAPEEAR
jgi:cytochrome c-type biogenesis protein CcmH